VLRVELSSRLASATADWEDGRRRLERARRDPDRVDTLDRVVAAIRRELYRRLGQTYTLADLLDVYQSSGDWALDVAMRVAPGATYARELTVVADPVFAAAARGASDWSPYGQRR
jgi:hypothetical protein